MNIIIKKLNKKYGKRKIKVFDDKKFLGEITEFMNWISISDRENHKLLRNIAMENLWWLLHNDDIDEDTTEEDAWLKKINKWNNKGKLIDGNYISLFFPGEYQIALNSINNK